MEFLWEEEGECKNCGEKKFRTWVDRYEIKTFCTGCGCQVVGLLGVLEWMVFHTKEDE